MCRELNSFILCKVSDDTDKNYWPWVCLCMKIMLSVPNSPVLVMNYSQEHNKKTLINFKIKFQSIHYKWKKEGLHTGKIKIQNERIFYEWTHITSTHIRYQDILLHTPNSSFHQLQLLNSASWVNMTVQSKVALRDRILK